MSENNNNDGNESGRTTNINITSNNQSGGVTAHTVNFQRPPRGVGPSDAQQLSRIPRSAHITVESLLGDGEAHQFASEIAGWFRANGYANVDGVTQVVPMQPMEPQAIFEMSANAYKVRIGSNR